MVNPLLIDQRGRVKSTHSGPCAWCMSALLRPVQKIPSDVEIFYSKDEIDSAVGDTRSLSVRRGVICRT